jgi:hypothetical protein
MLACFHVVTIVVIMMACHRSVLCVIMTLDGQLDGPNGRRT